MYTPCAYDIIIIIIITVFVRPIRDRGPVAAVTVCCRRRTSAFFPHVLAENRSFRRASAVAFPSRREIAENPTPKETRPERRETDEDERFVVDDSSWPWATYCGLNAQTVRTQTNDNAGNGYCVRPITIRRLPSEQIDYVRPFARSHIWRSRGHRSEPIAGFFFAIVIFFFKRFQRDSITVRIVKLVWF